MAKKMKPGKKRCPSCGASVKGPRTKDLPEVWSRIQGKASKAPLPKPHQHQPSRASRPAKKPAKKPAAAVVAASAAPAAVEKPTTNGGGTITLDQVKKVAQTIKTLGGFQRMTEVLAVIKECGGVKKFKDLAEAMTVAETATTTDAVPF